MGPLRLGPLARRAFCTAGDTSATSHLVRPLARRGLCTALRKMGVGDKPQVLLAASGVHTPTVVRDLTAALYELGGSVAATKKVVLGDHYSLLMSVWLPDKNEPAEAAAVLKEAFDKNFSALSTNLTLYPLDGGAAAAGAVCDEVVTRRLRVSCPQKPGVVLAITRLLQDHGATTSHMEAGTSSKAGTIWFGIECLVEVSPQMVDELANQLQFWGESAGATLNFDQSAFLTHAPLSHA